MTNASAVFREANSFDHKGTTGIVYTYHLPDLQACILAGGVPTPVLAELNTAATSGDIPTLQTNVEAIRAAAGFRRAVVRAMVDEVNATPLLDDDGLPCRLSDDDLDHMHPDDFNALASLGVRETDATGKA